MIGKFKCAAIAAAVLATSAAFAAAPSTDEQKAATTLARIGTLADTGPSAPRSKSIKAITEDPASCITDVGPQHARICGGSARFSDGQYAYLGIPYAAAQRWQNPQAVEPASHSRISYGPVCPQTVKEGTTEVVVGDENCLTINVWAPKSVIQHPSEVLPVMVFIHGGAFVSGSGGDESTNSEFGPMGHVVTVTFNYRLGAFGFLATDKDGVRAEGNYGLRDQVAALNWVHQYIAKFGGDPGNVTLFGESAGAMSVSLHTFDVAQSKGLFQRAIMESNPVANTYLTPAQSRKVGEQFVKKLCEAYRNSVIAICPANDQGWMNYQTKQHIVAAQKDFPGGLEALADLNDGLVGMRAQPFQPVKDDTLVAGEPYDGYAQGMPHMPLIFGVNEHEGVAVAAVLAGGDAQKPDALVYDTMLTHSFKDATAKEKIRGQSRYQDATYTTPRPYYSPTGEALSHVITDYLFTCANVWAAEKAAAALPAKPVRFYYFRQVPFFDLFHMDGPPADPRTSPCARVNGNVCHAVELPYVFGTFAAVTANSQDAYRPGFTDNYTGEMMHGDWAAFAKDGNVSGWPTFDSAHTAKVMIGIPNTGPVDIDAEAQCSRFWFTLHQPFDSLAH
jgi:para-nitrobenzyl esterase